MKKVNVLSIILFLQLTAVLSRINGPKCELTKAWFANPSATKTLPNFCEGSKQYALKGDFNGDGRMDVMCHDSQNGRKWIYYGANDGYSGVGWSKYMWWCTHAGASLYIGDFNGDSRDDILCHDKSGHIFIAYADKYGHFARTGWHKAMGFCTCEWCKLFIGDFNGDKKSDILCHCELSGRKWIGIATATGNFENVKIWYKWMRFCRMLAGPLVVGDFNGDGRDDLYCYKTLNALWEYGNMYIAYALRNGTFLYMEESANMRWCLAKGCTLTVAEASADGRDDLVCHCKSPSNNPVAIRFPYYSGGFEVFRQWRRARSWCNKATEMLFVGRLKPHHCGSLVCIDKATGKYSIAFS